MAIIGIDDETGMSSALQSSTDPHYLMDGTLSYTAGANEEVFRFGAHKRNYIGSSGQQVEVGLYDITSGINGASLVASATLTFDADSAQWKTTDITPVSLTEGNEYAVGFRAATSEYRPLQNEFVTGATSTSNTLCSSALDSSWSDNGTLNNEYSLYAETQTSTALGDLVQSKQNSGGTATITLDSAPTSGNLLIYATPNGNSGATLSTPPSGFTELTSNTAANFSFWWGYKVSDGTETSSNHAWSEGNGNSLYAEYYWQQSALNPRVATNENTDNIATAGSGPQGTGSVTPDDLSQNFVLAVVAAQFQPNVDGSGAWSNGFTEDVGFAATPTIASVAIASLSSATGATEATYSWSDSTDETYGGIAAFSLKSGADFDSGPTVSDVKGSTATITTLAS